MPSTPSQLLFLPGASGNTRLWQPVADVLTHPASRRHVGWPGFGPTPAQAEVREFGDLVALVSRAIDRPTALIAQSMGGVVAVLAALAKPGLVTHLVLTVTSGGIDMAHFGAQDWREAFADAYPTVPSWFADCRQDLTLRLAELDIPTLLLWGDADPISPVGVGRHLAALLPRAALHVLAGGDHDLACTFARDIAPLIDTHLATAARRPPGD